MNNSNKKAFKAGTWYVISNFLNKGIAVFSTPIITRMLTPEEYGVTGTYSSLLSIFMILGTLNISSSIAVARFDYDTEEEYDRYISSVLSLSTLASTILYVLYKIFENQLTGIFTIPPLLMDFMYLNVIFTNSFNILQIKHRSLMRYKQFVFMSIVIAITSPILSIFLISLQDTDRYLGRILGLQLPTMIFGLILALSVFRRGRSFYNSEDWRYSLKIALPLIPHQLSGNILAQSDRLIINYFRGAVEVGLYTLSYSYSNILSTIWTSFNQAWSPWFMEKLQEKNYRLIKRVVKPYTIIFSIIFLGMIAVGPEALMIFGPPEYQDGVWVIAPVLLGLYFQFAYSLYVNAEIFYKKTKYISIATLTAGLIDLVLNFIFIPEYGFIGAAYTTLVGYLILFVIHYFVANRIVEEDFIGNKFLVTWTILMVFLTALFTILTNYIVLRYLLYLIVSVALLIFYRKEIKRLIDIFIENRKKK